MVNPWDPETGAEPDVGQYLCTNCLAVDAEHGDDLCYECAQGYEDEMNAEAANDR